MKKYFAKEDGQGLVEYAQILGLVSIVSIVSLGFFADGVGNKYDAFANVLDTEQLENGSYMITTEDGVYIKDSLGRMMGPYKGKETDIKIPSSLSGFNSNKSTKRCLEEKDLQKLFLMPEVACFKFTPVRSVIIN